MSTSMRADAQLFKHDNYATSTVAATKALPAHCSSILIDNVDSSISLLISFDGGSTFKTLKAGYQLSLDCDSILSYQIKSASSTPNAECLYGYEA